MSRTMPTCVGGKSVPHITGQLTLRASPSGTFLQTLPGLVTPMKGTLHLRAAVQRRGQRPPKGLDTNMTVEATQRPSTLVKIRRIHPG